MKPEEFKCLALSLMKEISNYKNKMEEGAYRTIIDRYYYFYFLYSRECLEKIDINIPKSSNAHVIVQKKLTCLLIMKHPGIQNELDSLRKTRNDASYQLKKEFSGKDTQFYIQKIDKIISYIKDEV